MRNTRDLTEQQRRNLAALRIMKEMTNRKYGKSVQIVTSEQEALDASGVMALPMRYLGTNKPVSMMFNKQATDSNGTEVDKGRITIAKDTEDLTEAIESAARRICPELYDDEQPVSESPYSQKQQQVSAIEYTQDDPNVELGRTRQRGRAEVQESVITKADLDRLLKLV